MCEHGHELNAKKRFTYRQCSKCNIRFMNELSFEQLSEERKELIRSENKIRVQAFDYTCYSNLCDFHLCQPCYGS